MKHLTPIFILFLFAAALGACNQKTTNTSQPAPVVNEQPKEASLNEQALHRLFDRIALERDSLHRPVLTNTAIQIGDTAIAVDVKMVHQGSRDSTQIYVTQFTTTYSYPNAEPISLTIRFVGAGVTEQQAREISIQEWFATFALPFSSMLNGINFIKSDNMKVYPGLMGIRGKLPPDTWLTSDAPMNEKILAAIKPVLKANSKKLYTVNIKLMLEKGGLTEGECRMDGEISTELFTALKKLDWPGADEKFMFKQFYLIDRR